ncbi:MAG TPA: hypothetical protein VGQ26_18395 [Streptosporangiaceae bacterium]|nr:hypothetical protein [Streptosporangiaceae bacterium]
MIIRAVDSEVIIVAGTPPLAQPSRGLSRMWQVPMTSTTSSTSTTIALAEPVFTGPERVALAGFLAGAAR